MYFLAAVAAHLGLLVVFAGVPVLTGLAIGACLLFHAVTAWGIVHPRSRVFGPNQSRLGTSARVVSLTFDDGPHPEVTPRLLDLLRARGVRATFFLIGREAARHPDLVRRIAAEGHLLGNHTLTHRYLYWALPPRGVEREIAGAQQAIEAGAGVPCRWFRPPVGLKSPWQRSALARLGLRQVSWEVRFIDRRDADAEARLARRLRRRLRPGSVLLLHDGADRDPRGNPAVLDAVPRLLDTLALLGYRCEPLA
jgi:peptidoglycan/xylan/chitin deacetylase (PgdA/CDA1 family)